MNRRPVATALFALAVMLPISADKCSFGSGGLPVHSVTWWDENTPSGELLIFGKPPPWAPEGDYTQVGWTRRPGRESVWKRLP